MLQSGKLDVKNMALHLLLDVGQFLNANAPSRMRYSKTSLDYWLVIQKLFKGKGVRFFRGVKTGPAKKLKGMCTFFACAMFILPLIIRIISFSCRRFDSREQYQLCYPFIQCTPERK